MRVGGRWTLGNGRWALARGLPMVRALFIEYPDDPGSWQIDDEYLLGSQILVAPLMSCSARLNWTVPNLPVEQWWELA